MTKIMVIEDEESLREIIVEMLVDAEFQVIDAENGQLGVELAQKELPDLIICDVMMPELDGYGVLTRLRENQATQTMPFIFLTAKSTKGDMRQGMQLGADDYLTKPFTMDELLGAVEARLERAAMQNQKLQQVSEELEKLEYFDALTGLPNQSALRGERGYLNQAIAQIGPSKRLVPFLLLNLDRFARINDTIGYNKGDIILQELGKRLVNFVQTLNLALPVEGTGVARLTGDEFAIILSPVRTQEEALLTAQEILKQIAQPFYIQSKSIPLTATVGISFYPYGRQVEELRRQADVAMREAKGSGGNSCQIYVRPMFGVDDTKDLQLAADFYKAWEQKQLQVCYQPIVDLRKKKIVGVKAIGYWQHPIQGTIPQTKIISLASETGLSLALGEWVWQTACQQVKLWQQSRMHLRVAVTLPEQLFAAKDLLEKIAQPLSGVDPKYLELEVAADTIAKATNLNQMGAKLLELKRLGTQTTIAQFGLAHTALPYLGELALDNLKLDRALVANNSSNATILGTIIKIARDLKLRAIASGVETDSQIALLKKQKCDEIQKELSVSSSQIKRLLGKR